MRAVFAVLFVIGVAAARQVYNDQTYEDYVPPVKTNVPQIKDLKFVSDKSGQYSHGFESTDGTQFTETGKLVPTDDGKDFVLVKSGTYKFYTPDGVLQSITFDADKLGYRPVGDSIPKVNH